MLVSGINPGSGWAEKTTELVADRTFGGFLEQSARTRFPEFSEVERLWAMVHTFTADGLPLVGALPGHSRMHVLSGFGNRSWSLGVGAGVALGRRLAGLEAELPESAYARRLLN
jgi:glycine/D-amino acid oxidase-like deaminating enzyme